ncbi:MAG: tyrosine-type recombinase/integrase [Verrucomicrobiales bacterium]
MPRRGKKEYVTFKSVRLPVYPHTDSRSGAVRYRFAYPDESVKGGWRYGTRSTKQAAREAAHAKAVEIANGLLDLSALTPDQARLCRAFLDLKPTWEHLDALKQIIGRNTITIAEAVAGFHADKLKEHGKTTNHLSRQKTYLDRIVEHTENAPLAGITHTELQAWLDDLEQKLGPKSVNDHRAAAVALWRWAEKKEIISPQGNYNEAQKTTPLKLSKRSNVETYSPREMRLMLDHVSPDLLPWLCIVAFSGIRSGELRGKGKEPLTWDAVKRSQGVIDCPAHLSKNGKRKLVPIIPTLEHWLAHIGATSGSAPIVPRDPNKSETTKLGNLIEGGWKKNGLRHSYGSYRIADTKDIAATSLEMDNSPAIIKKHYLEAKTEEEAKEYFNLLPIG